MLTFKNCLIYSSIPYYPFPIPYFRFPYSLLCSGHQEVWLFNRILDNIALRIKVFDIPKLRNLVIAYLRTCGLARSAIPLGGRAEFTLNQITLALYKNAEKISNFALAINKFSV
ncbi:hypothetical protein [Moorena sp. SIO3I6]|uniref:hypothetical protein n=1 Tax=Moorena sp. SIO3I6 TaxID=2607831 RepID=UPI0025EE8277|nr:hypothetical protein [Moorena sp. SIO3I6]